MSRPVRTRRQFIRDGSVVALAAGAPLGLLTRPRPSAAAPSVAIVGAGLAGLTCAYRLHQRGVAATVYEAHPERIGGRCWTARGFPGGQTGEHGGELIDTAHVRIRALAAELGLRLDDLLALAARQPGLRSRYVFDGRLRSGLAAQATSPLLTAAAARDQRRIGKLDWRAPTRAAQELDEMTADQWLRRVAPGPENAVLRAATDQFMAEEYGLNVDRLSALNMLLQYGPDGVPSDERFHVHGGNDQIPHGLARRLPAGTVRLGHALTGLRRTGRGYALAFDGRSGEVVADLVVLCLPFTALRRVDLTAAGLSPRKRRCIEQLGMGTNAKLLLSFRRPLDDYDRFDGVYTDGEVDTWNSALGERPDAGLMTVYSGGRHGADYRTPTAHGPAPDRIVNAQLARIDRVVPGLAAGFDGRAWLDHWVADPWIHGSYAAYLPGQVTRWYGFVGLPEAGIHFAGEHTCTAALGFMEGAVRSGERTAREVLERLGR